MAMLEILLHPDERLHIVASLVEEVNDEIKTLIEDMTETMYESKGIGLAATQVNVHKQVLVIDLSEEHNDRRVFINAKIVAQEGKTTYQEGCLSIPGIYDDVERAEKITVEALDENGQPFTLTTDGLLAICLQHEIDHLQGKLFIQYLSKMKQNRIKTKMLKLKKQLAI